MGEIKYQLSFRKTIHSEPTVTNHDPKTWIQAALNDAPSKSSQLNDRGWLWKLLQWVYWLVCHFPFYLLQELEDNHSLSLAHSHISCMKGWPGSKFSHPTDCRSWSGWCSWLDGVPFSLLCHECPLWSCTLRWRKQSSLRRKTILLAAHSSSSLWSSSQEVSSVNWKLSFCYLAFSSRQVTGKKRH